MDHCLPILQEHGLLAERHLDQFNAAADWVPLYTPESLQKHLLAALSAFVNAGLPSSTAVVLPEMCVGTDREFFLTNFHRHELSGEAVNQHWWKVQAAGLLSILWSCQ